MELWIRSQDKMLLSKLVDIRIVIEQEYTSIIDDTTGYILGSYKTKKKALSIIDDIQDHITRKDMYGNRYYDDIIVYQMPK